MKIYNLIIVLLTVMGLTKELPAQLFYGENPLASTYSIVARDPDTGEMGVAVQSHWFSVGTDVPWVKAGVGAVATQSLTDVTYGPLGLELMRREGRRSRR